MFSALKKFLFPQVNTKSESVQIYTEGADGDESALLCVVVMARKDIIQSLEQVVRADVYNVLRQPIPKIENIQPLQPEAIDMKT